MIKSRLAQRPVLAADQDPCVLSSDAEGRPDRRPWPSPATIAFVTVVNLAAWTGVVALGIAVL